ncbi:MAG: M48 family metallopeptidase [Planctomycetota bacterium]
MDFFEHQDRARKKTGRLIALMALAVAAITALVFGLVVVAILAIQDNTGRTGHASGLYATGPAAVPWLKALGLSAAGVLAVVGGGSLYKTSQLAGGGKVVARSLGGRPIEADTTDPDERTVLNVVEEMSIASGAPVPTVYLLDHEDGINAFAAGWTLDDAVIGVTRGCIQQLTRDELQGVIAHEFSHILNGDMRINLRLVGVIFGILVISVIGAGVMRSIAYSGRSRSRSSKDGGGGVIAIFLIGLGLYVIGYVGVFFGKLIQAAVSRQREFLADASAVQFTRNPEGIAGALRRIGGVSQGSKLLTAHAVEHSHLFFGSAVTSFLGGVFATHPPLPERISRVLPSWDGTFLAPLPPQAKPREHRREPGTAVEYGQRIKDILIPGAAGFVGGEAPTGSGPDVPIADGRESAIAQIGQLTPAHLRHARELIDRLPAVLRSAAHTSTGAQALVFALLLDRKDAAVMQQQLTYLSEQAAGPVAVLTGRLADAATSLPVEQRLPLLDLALPSLTSLHPQVQDQLQAHVDQLVEADRRLDLFEWALRQVIWRHLACRGQAGNPPQERPQKFAAAAGSLSLLMSVLAHVGGRDGQSAAAAFSAGQARLPGETRVELLPREGISMGRLTDAVDELARLLPVDQRSVITACAAVIAADGRVTSRESELMRAVAETLGVPVPPLLAGQRLV